MAVAMAAGIGRASGGRLRRRRRARTRRRSPAPSAPRKATVRTRSPGSSPPSGRNEQRWPGAPSSSVSSVPSRLAAHQRPRRRRAGSIGGSTPRGTTTTSSSSTPTEGRGRPRRAARRARPPRARRRRRTARARATPSTMRTGNASARSAGRALLVDRPDEGHDHELAVGADGHGGDEASRARPPTRRRSPPPARLISASKAARTRSGPAGCGPIACPRGGHVTRAEVGRPTA